jgi:hypothetical protein
MLYRDYCIHRGVRGHDATWVAPFGNPGIIARWQLPQAYRSLLRPSSPVVPRYPPVCSYVLTKTLFWNTFLKLQSMLCAWTRSHVWHMKVLLYAVFKVRGLFARSAGDRIERAIEASGFRTLKAEQCSPGLACAFSPIDFVGRRKIRMQYYLGDPRCEGRATEAEKLRAASSHPRLSSKEPGEP